MGLAFNSCPAWSRGDHVSVGENINIQKTRISQPNVRRKKTTFEKKKENVNSFILTVLRSLS